MWQILGVLSLIVCCGCGCTASQPVIGPASASPSARDVLTEIAKTGEMTGETHIEEEIEKIRTTDPSKAADLQNDYNVLSRLEEQGAIKQQAHKLMGKFK